ncbi:hypothetical protein C8Q75DRAFT_625308 [Abortiporus biennis]|nr:hypothetical protein C8Q75DRAFT_625308 [Abortiporus biennis]
MLVPIFFILSHVLYRCLGLHNFILSFIQFYTGCHSFIHCIHSMGFGEVGRSLLGIELELDMDYRYIIVCM